MQEPFKLANRKFHPDNSVVEIAPGVVVGGKKLVVMAGQCSVPKRKQIIDVASVQADGATVLHGGAWKPRSSYSFQGLKAEVWSCCKAHEATGLRLSPNPTNPAHRASSRTKCDLLPGRHAQYAELQAAEELGQTRKPILLKRGFAEHHGGVPDECQYIMAGATKTLSSPSAASAPQEVHRKHWIFPAVPVLKRMSHLPVVVDPSHAGGIYWMVEPLAKAAVAAGADGLMIEVHNDPAHALSDGAQSLTYDSFHHTMNALRAVAAAVDREI